MDNKIFLKSKTVWGVIVMALPVILPLFGVNIDTSAIGGAGDQILTAVGAILAIYGRVKASGGISVK